MQQILRTKNNMQHVSGRKILRYINFHDIINQRTTSYTMKTKVTAIFTWEKINMQQISQTDNQHTTSFINKVSTYN